ncbi:hypothetical protein, partial [uncultured Rhodospira sp.]|uniref:hypothetical protein n=1 Tax=uncultured Rhodospira sp. TaxID=1936189 RepID=UPI002627E3B4
GDAPPRGRRGHPVRRRRLRRLQTHPTAWDTRITQAQLDPANGDKRTRIPSRLNRPAHWTTAPPA